MSRYQCEVGGKIYEVTLIERGTDSIKIAVNGEPYAVSIAPLLDRAQIQTAQAASSTAHVQPIATKSVAGSTSKANEITAPMPGVVVAVKVSVGDEITPGQTVAVIEAMKMENNIQAQATGKVKEILVKATQEVSGGQVLINLTDKGK